MKEETRKLLNEIIYDYNVRQAITEVMDEKAYNEAKCFNEKQDKIQEFLRSIPNIEEKLRLGGYIADKNNTPCCHGDMIRFKVRTTKEILCGKLQWNTECARFEVFVDEYGEHYEWTLIIPEIEEFEKIE